jgi:hypothetical protein
MRTSVMFVAAANFREPVTSLLITSLSLGKDVVNIYFFKAAAQFNRFILFLNMGHVIFKGDEIFQGYCHHSLELHEAELVQ